jgi:hypothetical protein
MRWWSEIVHHRRCGQTSQSQVRIGMDFAEKLSALIRRLLRCRFGRRSFTDLVGICRMSLGRFLAGVLNEGFAVD